MRHLHKEELLESLGAIQGGSPQSLQHLGHVLEAICEALGLLTDDEQPGNGDSVFARGGGK